MRKKRFLSLVLAVTVLSCSGLVAGASDARAADMVQEEEAGAVVVPPGGEIVPSETTEPSETAAPFETTAPPETTQPSEEITHGDASPEIPAVISDKEWKKTPTGSAGVLEGKSVLISIYVNDKTSKWTKKGKKEAAKKVSAASSYITRQAKKYGKSVELICDINKYADICYNYSTKSEIKDTGKSQMTLYKKMKKFINNKLDVTALRQKYGTDSIGFLVHVNKSGTSSTLVHYVEDGSKYFYECSTLFSRYDRKPEGASTYAHEILHLFGARDLYEESWVDLILPSFVRYIDRKFPNEIMYSSYTMDGRQLKYKITNDISRITAYFLGWKKNIPEKKKYMLQDMKKKGCFCAEW